LSFDVEIVGLVDLGQCPKHREGTQGNAECTDEAFREKPACRAHDYSEAS
jgi:hypothetical protein